MEKAVKQGYILKGQKVKIRLTNNYVIQGTINIVGFERVSDFLQKNTEPYLILYNARTDDGDIQKTLLVSKIQILWIEPI
ncbi:MAG: hypothetical protein HQK76_02430 [Desulfobacterales bacterium]|nr:hypothetical protein [Desulfobacterales bacterium]